VTGGGSSHGSDSASSTTATTTTSTTTPPRGGGGGDVRLRSNTNGYAVAPTSFFGNLLQALFSTQVHSVSSVGYADEPTSSNAAPKSILQQFVGGIGALFGR
jgi:hypothetical protein